MKRDQSSQLYQQAKKYFPGGVNSPVRAFGSVEGDPLFLKEGKGAHIVDADDNEYVDYCCSWGPLILGHAPEQVIGAVEATMKKGTSFGAPSIQENELAQLILDNNSFIEKIRFVSSGTEAVMSAIRLARGYTGKNKIIKFEGCYHGHTDALLVKAGSGLVTFGSSSSAGVPKGFVDETIVLPLNNIDAIEQAFDEFGKDIAAIIIEPIPANNGLLLQNELFLKFLRSITETHNALLIFDEVISGFRIGFEGASGHYGIRPDIITYGKIIGGGFPVGAYASNNQIMAKIAPEGDVYQAGTLSGNPVAMSAGIAQLQACLEEGFYAQLEIKCKKLVDALNQHAEEKGYAFKVVQIGSIFWVAFSKDSIQAASDIDPDSMQQFKILHKELLERGVYLGPSGYEVGFMSAAHTEEDIEKTIQAFQESLAIVFA